VKPLAASKLLVKRKRRNGRVLSTRYSPTHETLYHIFEDLVHFTQAYGHPRLTLEILLTEQEEHRVAIRKVRKFGKDYRVADRLLRAVCARNQLRTLRDLAALLPAGLPETFSTQDVARLASIPRWLAQKMAYCLRKTGAVEAVSKQGNNLIYRVSPACRPAA
jgi:hypothetical protein